MEDNEIRKIAEDERKKSDEAYAIKLVEKIVFWFLATVAGGFIIGFITLFIDWLGKHLH